MKSKILQMTLAMFLCASASAQVNSGSNGSDGAFNPTTNMVINMADHPNGIYQYTSVNIPGGVTVTFIPNANNTPVYWLAQSNVIINGRLDITGQSVDYSSCCRVQGGTGGPGGWRGGNGQNGDTLPTSGQGPGGGSSGSPFGSTGSYTYGNIFLIPLLGGSGGGGAGQFAAGGGGGGGAILIVASSSIMMNGTIDATGGNSSPGGGPGSGGAIRLTASQITGNGFI